MSNIFDCGIGLLVLCVAASSMVPLAVAADPSENEVAVHHVHLSTHESEAYGKVHRTTLIAVHEACTAGRTLKGLPAAALPELPRYLWVGTLDLYYAANRSLSVSNFEHYDFDRSGDCTLLKMHSQIRIVASDAGTCTMNAGTNEKKRASGVCDIKLHEQASARPFLHRNDKLKPIPAEATKTVAGMQCDIYRVAVAGSDLGELCIAQVTDKFPAPFSPYQVAPGLLLSFDAPKAVGPMGVGQAESVELNTVIPRSMFEVPPGYAVTNINIKR